MQWYTSFLLLFHITCVTATTFKQPTQRLISKNPDVASSKKLLETSSRTFATNEERMVAPVDKWLQVIDSMADGLMVDGSELVPLRLSHDDSTADNLNVEGTPLNEKVALNEETSNEKLPDHSMISVAYFFHDPDGVTILSDLADTKKVLCFYGYVESVYRKNVNAYTLVEILEKHFKRTPLARTFEKLSSIDVTVVRRRGEDWQRRQLSLWFKRQESVMGNLGFNRAATRLYDDWKMNVLEKYVIKHNEWTGHHETMASFCSNYYGQANLLRMLVNTQNDETGRRWATRIQNELLEEWKTNGLQPDKVLTHLNVKDAIKLLTTSNLDLVSAQYPVGEVSKCQNRLWSDILKEHYDEESVLMELFDLKEHNKIAEALLEQQVPKW